MIETFLVKLIKFEKMDLCVSFLYFARKSDTTTKQEKIYEKKNSKMSTLDLSKNNRSSFKQKHAKTIEC